MLCGLKSGISKRPGAELRIPASERFVVCGWNRCQATARGREKVALKVFRDAGKTVRR
jgi:hypothetical protein